MWGNTRSAPALAGIMEMENNTVSESVAVTKRVCTTPACDRTAPSPPGDKVVGDTQQCSAGKRDSRAFDYKCVYCSKDASFIGKEHRHPCCEECIIDMEKDESDVRYRREDEYHAVGFCSDCGAQADDITIDTDLCGDCQIKAENPGIEWGDEE